uniref:Uncharacterized protein n=1 Tax=viral metagenome TaxID=1070528 RepID=A0A6M3IWG2_9ZZZZ
MDVSKKSIGVLIDELITTNIKCWMAQEKLMGADSDIDAGKAAKDAQALNARRNSLIRAIDEMLGQGDITLTEKSYAK